MLKKYWNHVLCITILSLIIGFHEHFYVVLFLWLLLGFLCLRDPKLAVTSVFFFAAFFHGAGFFQNLLVTLKHFHIALGILLVVSFVRWKWTRWKLKESWQPSLVLIFWIVLIAISTFSLWWVGEQFMTGVRANGNLFLTFLCGSLLAILITPEEAIHGLSFLAFGICVRAAFGLLAYAHLPSPYLNEPILYNNHLGFYCTTALFCLLPCTVTAKDRLIKSYFVIAFCFLFFVLLLTGSRTGYISFFGGLISFVMIQRWLRKKRLAGGEQKSVWLLLLSICLGSVVILLILGYLFPFGFLFPIISSRLWMALAVFDPWQWQFLGTQNFGFLGHYRMEQFQVLHEIVKQHLILGIGLVRRTTDFHSLYFTLLGGTGLTGLLTFIIFCVSWIGQGFHAMVVNDGKANVFRVALLSWMVSWLLYSFTETFFLQFHIWVIIAAGIALSKRMTVEQQLSDT